MFSWNVLWSTVLIATVMPDAVWKVDPTLARTSLGFGSDWLEPSDTVLEVEPVDFLSSSPQAASRPRVPSRVARPPGPRSSERGLTRATEEGPSRARYSSWVRGRDIDPPADG